MVCYLCNIYLAVELPICNICSDLVTHKIQDSIVWINDRLRENMGLRPLEDTSVLFKIKHKTAKPLVDKRGCVLHGYNMHALVAGIRLRPPPPSPPFSSSSSSQQQQQQQQQHHHHHHYHHLVCIDCLGKEARRALRRQVEGGSRGGRAYADLEVCRP